MLLKLISVKIVARYNHRPATQAACTHQRPKAAASDAGSAARTGEPLNRGPARLRVGGVDRHGARLRHLTWQQHTS